MLLEQGLKHDLGGEVTLDFRPDGLVYEITVPARAALGDGQVEEGLQAQRPEPAPA